MRPTPIHELEGQLSTMGRIRAGRKTTTRGGKTAPRALTAFRFTSSDGKALTTVAEMYGGTVREWNDPASPDRFEVYTDATEIRIALPRNPLTQWYELWEGGGCQRRCDGVTCTLLQGGGQDGGDPREEECLCARRGQVRCEKKTRLSVLLPEVRLLGTWRYDTTSDIAGKEIKAAVELIEAVQAQGIQRAVMTLVQHYARGRRRQFTIARLGLDESLDGLIAGAGRIAAVPGQTPAHLLPGAAGNPALGPGVPVTLDGERAERRDKYGALVGIAGLEADIVDAEIVGEGETAIPGAAPLPDPGLVEAWMETLSSHQRAKVLTRARQLVEVHGGTMPTRFEDIDLDLASIIQEEQLHGS